MSLNSGQPKREAYSSADAVKRVLTTAGITGAALTLSAAAALPAFACHGGGSGGDDKSKQGQSTQSAHETKSDDAKDSENKDADHGDKSKADDKTKSGDKTQDGKTQGGKTDDGHNPPGNNGTVKIHQTAGDSSPHNQPHVSCYFYVSFFGFDANQTMGISFTGQAPTGKGTAIPILDGKTSKTSTTDAGGAGNDYDGDQGKYDATNLDLSALGAPAKQGYHIKLDVATGEPGGHKYKVFWFTPCTSAPGGTNGGDTGGDTGGATGGTTQTGGDTGGATGGTTQTGGTTGSTAGGGTVEAVGGTTGSGATVLGETFTRGTTQAGKPVSGTKVLGESASRGSSSGLGALPFTGSETAALSALGLAALGGGAALTVAGRRRRRVGQHA
jgi:hypothetical protein